MQVDNHTSAGDGTVQFGAKQVPHNTQLETLANGFKQLLAARGVGITVKKHITRRIHTLRLQVVVSEVVTIACKSPHRHQERVRIGNAALLQKLKIGLRVIQHRERVFERVKVFRREPARAYRLLHLENNALLARRQMLEHLWADDEIPVEHEALRRRLCHHIHSDSGLVQCLGQQMRHKQGVRCGHHSDMSSATRSNAQPLLHDGFATHCSQATSQRTPLASHSISCCFACTAHEGAQPPTTSQLTSGT